jgi:hypothetical protein
MAISVIDPVGRAIERTRTILFRPFDLGKWFVLGFCAFLAQLGEGGFNLNFHGGGSSPRGGGPGQGAREALQEAWHWIGDNLYWLLPLALAIVAVSVAIGLLLAWLSSRGKFMFLAGVARNRAAVVAPWREFKTLGNSLFWFRLLFGFAALAVFLLIFGLGVLIAWPDIDAWRFGPQAVISIVVTVALFLPFALIATVIGLISEDFVVPVMYVRGAKVLAAWGIFLRDLVADHLGQVILFCLMRILLSIAVGLLGVVALIAACCVTCCIAALPYLSTVVLLPLPVFMRCYSLCFIEQFGDAWRVFADEAPSSPAGTTA